MMCEICKGSGWTGWYKPMSDMDGNVVMVFVPQRCICQPWFPAQQGVVIPATPVPQAE
jgi:hypothetical protein